VSLAGLVLTATLALVAGATPMVEIGLERVAAERGQPLRGKRVGLLSGAGSLAADGRHAVDILRAAGVDVRRLFGPEHGLRGIAAAGERVASGIDGPTGLPFVSLYGDRARPEAADLAGLDVLVIDLQDVGVRFYSYNSLLVLCLEAAAAAGVEVVVLDRPNPLGGERIEGPGSDPALPRSLMNMTPGPLVHGLTTGEMARYVNGHRPKPARLTVVPLRGWKRSMTWSDTGRSWIAPSPNLRSAEAALAYPGVALLEATNLSEGRGTETPFLLFGAPWLRAAAVASAVSVPGFDLEPARFTPEASAAAPEPKFRGIACAGVRVRVTDTRATRPYAFGLTLLAAVRRLHPAFRWARDGAALDALLGTRSVRVALERGTPVSEILATDEAATDAFRRDRASALLY
jgi:uncharacterized protein YbbC (DUF1343 family)